MLRSFVSLINSSWRDLLKINFSFSLIAVFLSDRLLEEEDWTKTGHHRIVPSLYHGVHRTPIKSTVDEVSFALTIKVILW